MKQKLVSILLVLCMVVALVPAIALTSAAANGVALPDGATAYDGTPSESLSGAGTEDSPYIIANTADFMYFYNTLAATATAGQVFKMTGDVYWNAQNKTTYKTSSKDFAGVLDGNGHTVYNAYYSAWSQGSIFGTVKGTIKNLTFIGSSITAQNAKVASVCLVLDGGLIDHVTVKDSYVRGMYIGGIVSRITGEATVSNCTMEGTLEFAGSSNKSGGSMSGIVNAVYLGGSGTIENCVNRATMQSAAQVATYGGILGGTETNNNPIVAITIKNCENYSKMTSTATDANVGGILGSINCATSVTIENCINHADLGGTGTIGGILAKDTWTFAGVTDKSIVITGCSNNGDITSTGDNVGGIIGSHAHNGRSVQISNCAVYANVKAANNAGLAVGSATSGVCSVTNCVLTGTVSATEGGGAIAGSSGSAPTVTNTYFSGVAGLKLVAAGTAATAETATDADFTGTTVLDALNVAAKAAGLPEDTWVKGKASGKPELRQFCTDPVEEPSAPEITIDGASLTIGGNVTMNLFVKKTTVAAAGVTLGKISIVDNDNTPYEVTDDSGDYYVFTIKGLRASEFGKNKIYHVQYTTADAPGTPIDCTATKEYSPLQYAINMYNADDKTETVTDLDKLLLSIVNYADAAAKTTVASTAFKAAHADADFSMLPTFADIIAEDTGVYDYDEKRKDDQHLPSISANLTETIALTLTFDGSDLYQTGNDNMMMIGNAEIPGKVNTLSVVFSELFATDLYNTITFTFVETYESGLVVTATTSLVQFLKSYQGTTEEALAAATAQYLYVARLFCLNNQPNA